MKWETITEDPFCYRLKVYGGWIMKSVLKERSDRGSIALAVSMVFVPDPNHEWSLKRN